MANEKLRNRVRQTCQGTGSGDLDIGSGAATSGFRAVSSAYSIGESGIFVLESDNDYEIFYGTRSDSTTLTRDIVIESSNSNSKIILDGGLTHIVYVDLDASGYVYVDSTGVATPGKAILTASTVSTVSDLTSVSSGFGASEAGVVYFVLGGAAQNDGDGGFYRWNGSTWDRLFLRKLLKFDTITGGDATPSVQYVDAVTTAGSTAITGFDDGTIGQLLYVFRGDSDITLTHSATLDLGGQDITLTESLPSISLARVSEGAGAKWVITGGGAGSGSQTVQDGSQSGDGVTTVFTLTGAAGVTVSNLDVYLSGLRQTPTTDFTVADNVADLDITFSSPPANGVPIFFIAQTGGRFSSDSVAASNVTYGGGSVQTKLDDLLIKNDFAPQSSDPSSTDGDIAFSDGTPSTNGFGSEGAGLYEKISGSWRKTARQVPFISGGTVAADVNNKEILVKSGRRYTLTSGDSIAGIIGLSDGEFCQLIAPASGSTTLEDEGSTTSGQSLKLSGDDLVIQSTDEAVYTITSDGANIRVSGGAAGGDTLLVQSTSGVTRRPLNERFNDYVTPEDFNLNAGAGNSTNDTQAWTDAIEAALSDNVRIKAFGKEYLIDDMTSGFSGTVSNGALVIPSDLSIELWRATFKGNSGSTDPVIQLDGSTFTPSITIMGDGCFDNSQRGYILSVGSGTALSLIRFDRVWIEGLKFFAGSGSYTVQQAAGFGDTGVAIRTVRGAMIKGCYFYGQPDTAIYATGGGSYQSTDDEVHLQIVNNYFENNASTISVRREGEFCTIMNNIVKNSLYGIQLADAGSGGGADMVPGPRETTIIGNNIINTARSAIQVRHAERGIIANNLIDGWNTDDATWAGIGLWGTSETIVQGNVLNQYAAHKTGSIGVELDDYLLQNVQGGGPDITFAAEANQISHNIINGADTGIDEPQTGLPDNFALFNFYKNCNTNISGNIADQEVRFTANSLSIKGSGNAGKALVSRGDARVSRSGVTTQYIDISPSTGANSIVSQCEPANGKEMEFRSTTDASDTTMTSGELGFRWRVYAGTYLRMYESGLLVAQNAPKSATIPTAGDLPITYNGAHMVNDLTAVLNNTWTSAGLPAITTWPEGIYRISCMRTDDGTDASAGWTDVVVTSADNHFSGVVNSPGAGLVEFQMNGTDLEIRHNRPSSNWQVVANCTTPIE